MTLHAALHAHYPASQDGFATTTEMGEWLVEHRLSTAQPNEPFLLILRRIAQRAASCHFTHGTNEDYLDTRVYLGIAGDEPEFARVVGPTLLIAARRYLPLLPKIVMIERGFHVPLGDFLQTPIKEPFMPLCLSGFAPGEVTQAFTLDVGLEAIEGRVLAECEHTFGLVPWYAKASYRLEFAPMTGPMRAAILAQKQLVLTQLRSALLGRLDPGKYIEQARELGLDKDDGVIEIEEGVFFSPIALLGRARPSGRAAA